MPAKKKFVSMILDESGSMGVVRETTISGFNEYVQSIRNETPKAILTLTQFNSCTTKIVHDSVAIKDVPTMGLADYDPNCGTPLYDAIGKTVNALSAKVGKSKANVLVVIFTDGEENSSTEYTLKAIQALIKEKRAAGWDFIYIGANMEAWQAKSYAQSMGVAADWSTGVIQSDMASNMRMMSVLSNNYMGHNGASPAAAPFPDDEEAEKVN